MKTAVFPEKTAISQNGCHSVDMPADLAAVVSAWPGLPEYVRRTILDLVRNQQQR